VRSELRGGGKHGGGGGNRIYGLEVGVVGFLGRVGGDEEIQIKREILH
jgi:hypothetical protein